MNELTIAGLFAAPFQPRVRRAANWAAAILGFPVLCALPLLGQQRPPSAPQAASSAVAAESPAQPPQELKVDGQVIGERVPPEPGEICLVCGKPIGKGDVVYLVNGHRVPLHRAVCYAALRRHPWKYLALINPHGAFLGSGGEAQKISLGWLFFGLYILLGLVFAALCAHRAVNAGHNPVAWFGAGLALNAVGYLLLITRRRGQVYAPAGMPGGLRKIPLTYSPRPCPRCGASNHPSARQCAACGAALEAQVISEVQKTGRDSPGGH